jgi:hypothetical protein
VVRGAIDQWSKARRRAVAIPAPGLRFPISSDRATTARRDVDLQRDLTPQERSPWIDADKVALLLARPADQPDRRIFSGRRRDEFELTKMR